MEKSSKRIKNTTDDDIVNLMNSSTNFVVNVMQISQDLFKQASHILNYLLSKQRENVWLFVCDNKFGKQITTLLLSLLSLYLFEIHQYFVFIIYTYKPFQSQKRSYQMKIFFRIILLFVMLSIIYCQDYVVGYLFQNSLQQRLKNNQVRLYEKFRFHSSVYMNDYTRQMLSKRDILKNLTEVSSQTLLKPQFQGSISFQRSNLPQHFWIQNKQIVIIQIDISTFPTIKQQRLKYENLFRHKGQSFYMINSNKTNETVSKQIIDLFGIELQKEQICKINLQDNTIEQNREIITECFSKSKKKIVMGRINISFMYMIYQYGMMGLIYMFLLGLVACGSPYLMIWLHKRQKLTSSHI